MTARRDAPVGKRVKLEAKKNKWRVAISVVDNAGFLVAFHRLEWTAQSIGTSTALHVQYP
jgi:uncharacterized protein GlcG (DUF336 family)